MTLAERMAAIAAQVEAASPGRSVTRDLLPFDLRSDHDLASGVWTVLSEGERDYANLNGREAMDGVQRIRLVGQLRLPEEAPGSEIEDAEFAMVEEIQAMVRALPAGLCPLVMTGFEQSRQLDRPYGWVAISLEFGP